MFHSSRLATQPVSVEPNNSRILTISEPLSTKNRNICHLLLCCFKTINGSLMLTNSFCELRLLSLAFALPASSTTFLVSFLIAPRLTLQAWLNQGVHHRCSLFLVCLCVLLVPGHLQMNEQIQMGDLLRSQWLMMDASMFSISICTTSHFCREANRLNDLPKVPREVSDGVRPTQPCGS